MAVTLTITYWYLQIVLGSFCTVFPNYQPLFICCYYLLFFSFESVGVLTLRPRCYSLFVSVARILSLPSLLALSFYNQLLNYLAPFSQLPPPKSLIAASSPMQSCIMRLSPFQTHSE